MRMFLGPEYIDSSSLTGWWFGAGLFVLFFYLRSASDSFYSTSEDELDLGEMREVYALVSGL